MTAFLRWLETISGSGVTNRVESDGSKTRSFMAFSSGPAPEKERWPPDPESRRSPPREEKRSRVSSCSRRLSLEIYTEEVLINLAIILITSSKRLNSQKKCAKKKKIQLILKGPKLEIFVAEIFCSWIGDLGTGPKKFQRSLCLGLILPFIASEFCFWRCRRHRQKNLL